MDCVTAKYTFILIIWLTSSKLEKICSGNKQILAIPAGLQSQVRNQTYPMCVWCSLFLAPLFSSMQPLIGAVVLYLQVYHPPHPFSFSESYIFKHTPHKCTPDSTSVDGDNTDLKSQKTVEDSNWMDSMRLFMTQSSLGGAQQADLFFHVSWPLLLPKIFVWGICWRFHALHWFFLGFGFLWTWEAQSPWGVPSRPSWVRWLWTGVWIHFPSMHFEPTFSTPDSFQVQIWLKFMTKQGYIKCWRQNSGFSSFIFMPFLNFCFGVGHITQDIAFTIKKLCDWLPVLVVFF